jgi:integrase
MASVKRQPSGKWRARYRDPDGHEHARHFGRRVDAERWLTSVEHSKLVGSYVDPQAGQVTFGAFAEAWQSRNVHRPSTAAQLETNLRLHILPVLGNRPMAAVRPSEVQAWVKGRAGVLAPPTVELVYRYVVAIFRAAVADRIIVTSPCTGIRLPVLERHQVVPPTTDQVVAIRAALPARYRALVTLCAGTGLRQGEAFGLTVDRVDFLRRSLTVDRQLVLMPGEGPQLAPPKTPASYRSMPLPDVVLGSMSAHLASFGAGPDGVVFTNDAGGPIRRTRFSDVWRPAARTAGIAPGTGLHALRHYYASLLIRHGESVKVVQARLGHASAAETLDTYSHLWPDSEDRTRLAIDSVLGAPADCVRTADGL